MFSWHSVIFFLIFFSFSECSDKDVEVILPRGTAWTRAFSDIVKRYQKRINRMKAAEVTSGPISLSTGVHLDPDSESYGYGYGYGYDD